MKVIAELGLKVPYEDKPREYITDAAPVEVPDTMYYQRRISDGDLKLPALTAEPAKPEKGVKTTSATSAD